MQIAAAGAVPLYDREMRLVLGFATALAIACGCVTGPPAQPRSIPEPAPIAEPLLAPLTLTVAHPAAAYNEPFVAEDPTPLAEAVRATMREVAGTRGEITADPRLDIAAGELASVASRDSDPSAALVEFVLRSHGIAEPAERVLVAWTAPEADAVLAALLPRLDDAVQGRLRAGIGSAGGGPVVAVIIHDTGVDLVAAPRAVASHGGFELAATLDPRLDSPRIVITHEDGTIDRPAAAFDVDGHTFHTPFACGDHIGRQWIEIDATGLGGALPRAVFPVLCGGTSPSQFAVEPAANLTHLAGAAAIERRLTSIINRERARIGLPLLRSDAGLAASAHQHSAAVRDARAAGRPADPTTPADRVRAAGIAPVSLRENFLEVDGVARAAEELMNDAVFRDDAASPTATHLAVGVARDDTSGRLLVTITYAEFPPAIDAPHAAGCLTEAVDTVTGSRADLALWFIAQRFADGLARGRRRDELWPIVRDDIENTARGRFGKVGVAVVTATDITQLDPRNLIRGDTVDRLGLGVAQSSREGPQGGVTWIVALLGGYETHRRSRLDNDDDAAARRACLAAAIRR